MKKFLLPREEKSIASTKKILERKDKHTPVIRQRKYSSLGRNNNQQVMRIKEDIDIHNNPFKGISGLGNIKPKQHKIKHHIF